MFQRNWYVCGTLPNQQRTLNKLLTELRCRNFVTKHRAEHTNRRERCKKTCMQCVHIPTELAPCIATVGGWVRFPEKKKLVCVCVFFGLLPFSSLSANGFFLTLKRNFNFAFSPSTTTTLLFLWRRRRRRKKKMRIPFLSIPRAPGNKKKGRFFFLQGERAKKKKKKRRESCWLCTSVRIPIPPPFSQIYTCGRMLLGSASLSLPPPPPPPPPPKKKKSPTWNESDSRCRTQPPTVACKVEAQSEYVRNAYMFSHVCAPLCLLSRRLVTKFLLRSSGGSLLRVRCWLGSFFLRVRRGGGIFASIREKDIYLFGW